MSIQPLAPAAPTLISVAIYLRVQCFSVLFWVAWRPLTERIRTHPGDKTLTLTPFPAHSPARDLPNIVKPALLALYAHWFWGVLVIRPEMDETNRITLSFLGLDSVGNQERYAVRAAGLVGSTGGRD